MENQGNVKLFVESILTLRAQIKQFVQMRIKDEQLDLTYEMLQLLGVLWASGEMNQQQLADRIQKNKASVTSLIDNLVKRGLVMRVEDSVDRRNKIVRLTNEGNAQESSALKIWKDLYDFLQAPISNEELNETTQRITAMIKSIENKLPE